MSEAVRIEEMLQSKLTGCTNDFQKLLAHLEAVGACYAAIGYLEAKLEAVTYSRDILKVAVDDAVKKLDELV